MGYMESFQARLDQELKAKGFMLSGSVGAKDVYIAFLLNELAKLNERLEVL